MAGLLSVAPSLWTKQPVPVQDMTVSQFLNSKAALGKPDAKPGDARDYVLAHCRELLDIALSTSENAVTRKAFILLSTASSQVANQLMHDEMFLMKATEVLCDPKVDYSRVSRLSCVLNNIFEKARGGFAETLGVLTQLLAFVDDPSVFSLFCSIVDKNSKLVQVHSLLIETNFAAFLLNALATQESPQKAANLCAIVDHCLNHIRLRKSFVNVTMLNTLVGLLGCEDVLVQNQLWQALSSFCSQSTGGQMVNVLAHALQILKEKKERLNMYHVCACDFVEKMLHCCPNLFGDEDRKTVIEIMLSLMKNHGNSTNIICSVFRLLRTAVKTKEMRRDVLTGVFPVLIEYAQAKARTAVAACSLAFMADVEDSRANNKAVNKVLCSDKAYCHFLNSYLKPYMAQMALASYGGPVARYVQKSSSLGDVTKHLRIEGSNSVSY